MGTKHQELSFVPFFSWKLLNSKTWLLNFKIWTLKLKMSYLHHDFNLHATMPQSLTLITWLLCWHKEWKSADASQKTAPAVLKFHQSKDTWSSHRRSHTNQRETDERNWSLHRSSWLQNVPPSLNSDLLRPPALDWQITRDSSANDCQVRSKAWATLADNNNRLYREQNGHAPTGYFSQIKQFWARNESLLKLWMSCQVRQSPVFTHFLFFCF